MNHEKLKEWLKLNAEISLDCLPEDLPVKGNNFDKECENKIYRELESGNGWAWCCVKVSAKWRGFEGTDYLRGCSYESEKDFKNDGDYSDMLGRAIEDLSDTIINARSGLSQLEESLLLEVQL